MSPGATGSAFMLAIVRALVIGSGGIGGSGGATGFVTSASKKGGDDGISLDSLPGQVEQRGGDAR